MLAGGAHAASSHDPSDGCLRGSVHRGAEGAWVEVQCRLPARLLGAWGRGVLAGGTRASGLLPQA